MAHVLTLLTLVTQVGTWKSLSIADTPCYRDTLLYSMTAALSSGLIHFMFSSMFSSSVASLTHLPSRLQAACVAPPT